MYHPFHLLISKWYRRLCGHYELVPVSYTASRERISRVGEHAITSGGFGDVWKANYDGRDVAVKALRIYKTDDVRKIKRVGLSAMGDRVFCSFSLFSLGLLQRGYHLEMAVASKYCSVHWSYRFPRPSVHGIGVDAKRSCTRICQGTPGSESVTTCTSRLFACTALHGFLLRASSSTSATGSRLFTTVI